MPATELIRIDVNIGTVDCLQFTVGQYPYTEVHVVGPRGGQWGSYSLSGMVQLLQGKRYRLKGQNQGDKILKINNSRTALTVCTSGGSTERTYEIETMEIARVAALLPQTLQSIKLDFQVDQNEQVALIEALEHFLEEHGIFDACLTVNQAS